MQRIALLFVGLLALGGPRATAQQATGTTLWRVAATTLATPAALALGPSAALWNPAQPEDGARLQFGVDAIQTPSAVDATGVIATVRVPAGSLGKVGVLFGRVGLSNIAQTIDSPDPTGGVIPVYTFMAGATWSRIVARTSFGATLAFHETRLDTSRADRWTIDVGASRAVAGDRLRVAAATHFFSSFKTNDPSQDVFARIEGRIWSGAPSGDRGGGGGRQVLPRLWQRPVARWAEATDLAVSLRSVLDEAFPLRRLTLKTHQASSDGTEKFLWMLEDGEAIESVLIPEGRRRTLCISSQAGCALACVFCATGRMGFQRNLSAAEIAGQVRELMLRDPALKPTNIVFMGMGEPLLNWDAVDTTLTILNQPEGFGIGARHITVSTVGILPNLARFAQRPEQFRLAVSLHAPSPALRRELMPIEKKYSLPELMDALKQFRRRVTLEYVLIGGENKPPPKGGHPAEGAP